MSEVAEGPQIQVIAAGRGGRREPGHGLGDEPDDLVGADDAQVIVGQEREGPPPLPCPAVEDDRPRLGDRQGAGGEDAVDGVELLVTQPAVGDGLDSSGSQSAGRSVGTARRRTPLAAQAPAMAEATPTARPGGPWPCSRRGGR